MFIHAQLSTHIELEDRMEAPKSSTARDMINSHATTAVWPKHYARDMGIGFSRGSRTPNEQDTVYFQQGMSRIQACPMCGLLLECISD